MRFSEMLKKADEMLIKFSEEDKKKDEKEMSEDEDRKDDKKELAEDEDKPAKKEDKDDDLDKTDKKFSERFAEASKDMESRLCKLEEELTKSAETMGKVLSYMEKRGK